MEPPPGMPFRAPGAPSAAAAQGSAPHEPRGSGAAERAREIQEVLAAARAARGASAKRSTNAGAADRAPGWRRVLEERAAAGRAPAPARPAGPAGAQGKTTQAGGEEGEVKGGGVTSEESAALAPADDGSASAWAAAIASSGRPGAQGKTQAGGDEGGGVKGEESAAPETAAPADDGAASAWAAAIASSVRLRPAGAQGTTQAGGEEGEVLGGVKGEESAAPETAAPADDGAASAWAAAIASSRRLADDLGLSC